MSSATPAVFNLNKYKFKSFAYQETVEVKFHMDFKVSGEHKKQSNIFVLDLMFSADTRQKRPKNICKANLIAEFELQEGLEELPEYFFKNSIAIVFPYLRAFISTLTAQSQGKVLILPIMNLTKLGAELKENYEEVEK